MFKIADLGDDFDKPLTPNILSNPEHKAVKHIMYIYSMESFIYTDLNVVCREKDKSKIKYFGAFAAALSFIIHCANQNRVKDKLQDVTTLYRGVKMPKTEVEKLEEGSITSLLGYTSTSKDFNIALEFAFNNEKNEIPVIFEILFKGSTGLFQLTSDFSAYPGEQEVLIQDGFSYLVTSNKEELNPSTNEKYHLIKLSYPA